MADEAPAHVSGVRKGEEIIDEEGSEPGRATNVGQDDTPAGRPHGTSDARDDTSVDPQEPVTGTTPKG